MSEPFSLGIDTLTPDLLVSLACKPNPAIKLSTQASEKIQFYRRHVDKILASEEVVYGINTGFGYLSQVKIDKSKLTELQINLIRSHACGVGEYLEDHEVRALLLLRAHTFALGHSGVSLALVELLLEFLRHDILPLVPSQGSVGASGDLAPLAHLALGLIGEGKCRFAGKVAAIAPILSELGIKALVPKAKEGLALINGTHFMAAVSAKNLEVSKSLMQSADVLAALSLDGMRGSLKAFDPRIQNVRPHPGQKTVAANLNRLYAGPDAIHASHQNCGKVQDPYSFRCVPQVHGASRDVFAFVHSTVERELNSVTDNPLVFDDGSIVSGGNFHGQPLAYAMDFLAIAMAELGSIAERRVEKLTNPNMSDLPAFAIDGSGLNSGFMIPHVVTAALVSENKILCHPASVDSIPTSADKEDHVSMGSIAAVKAKKVLANLSRIMAIELLIACQSLDLLAPLKPGQTLAFVYDLVRQKSDFLPKDRSLHEDIEELALWLREGGLIRAMLAKGYQIE